MAEYIFPDDFKWGVATSSYQIEGAYDEDGKGESIWDRLSHTNGRIYNGDTGDIACDHYHRYKDDVKMMKDLGVGTYRFSTSWARILPDGSGSVNQKGLDFYKRLVDELLNKDIDPHLTLYHWDLPQKLQDIGGWGNREIVKYFTEYANIMYDALGDKVKLWATFNEPHAIFEGYRGNGLAPAANSMREARLVIHNLLLSHGSAVKSFRSKGLDKSRIGIAIDIWKGYPAREIEEDIEIADDWNEEYYRIFLNPIFKGNYTKYILEKMRSEGNLPDIMAGDMELISQPLDFIGLNIYSRSIISADPVLNSYEERKKVNPEKFAALNHEICPEVLYDIPFLFKNEYHDTLPVYITENGCPIMNEPVFDDNIHDKLRLKYMKSYLRELSKAITDGVNVKGYYYWSLMDNFEWTFGYTPRCGLIYTDYGTQQMIWKDSAYYYKKIIKNNGVI